MKIAAICLCWLSILTAPSVMAQQPTTPNQSYIAPNQSWDALRQLQGEDALQVERKAGKKKRSGKMVSLSDAELVIERKGKKESFNRDEVRRVWRIIPASGVRKARSTIAWGATGSAIGFVVGLGIILSSCQDGCGEAEFYAPIAVATIAGGLFGYFGERGKRTLIYSAP
jgi:hypothetical protein